MVALLEHRGEVVGDAGHAHGAERLDARLLDRVEDGAGVLAARRVLAVDGRVVAGEAQRHGESPTPRVTATSCSLMRRGGSGSRALFWASDGRSAAKLTSSSGLPAIARMQPTTARLNGSVGLSAGLVRGVSFGIVTDDLSSGRRSPSIPAALR